MLHLFGLIELDLLVMDEVMALLQLNLKPLCFQIFELNQQLILQRLHELAHKFEMEVILND